MSSNLTKTWETNYIQSPSDDIESFFWVFFWAVLQNNTTGRSNLKQQCARSFEDGRRGDAFLDYMSERSDMRGILMDWFQEVSELSSAYIDIVRCFTAIGNAGGWGDDEEEARYWRAVWHGLALEGICESLRIIGEKL